MPREEKPLNALAAFMPPGAFEFVEPYFRDHTIHLNLTRHRKSIHGDYRPPNADRPYHRISVNATLNPYSFLVTLLHEIAHMTTTVDYGLKVAPHGKEWKSEFRKALVPVLGKTLFPGEVEQALRDYLSNPAASTCTDPNLYKALSQFDQSAEGTVHADSIPPGGVFELSGRRFQKLENLRTRSRCKELGSGRIYYVQGIARVRVVE